MRAHYHHNSIRHTLPNFLPRPQTSKDTNRNSRSFRLTKKSPTRSPDTLKMCRMCFCTSPDSEPTREEPSPPTSSDWDSCLKVSTCSCKDFPTSSCSTSDQSTWWSSSCGATGQASGSRHGCRKASVDFTNESCLSRHSGSSSSSHSPSHHGRRRRSKDSRACPRSCKKLCAVDSSRSPPQRNSLSGAGRACDNGREKNFGNGMEGKKWGQNLAYRHSKTWVENGLHFFEDSMQTERTRVDESAGDGRGKTFENVKDQWLRQRFHNWLHYQYPPDHCFEISILFP